jgi:hypothetical protein
MESLPEMESDLSQFQWDTVTLRLTAYQKPDSEITITDWWKSVVGEVPEQQIAQPRSGEFSERGGLGPGRIDLNINPESMTWIHFMEKLQIEKHQQKEGLVSFGEFPSACEDFCSLMSNWFSLDAVPNLVRLAFGAVLFQPVQNQEEGISRLAKYIPAITLDPAPSSSFLYQVNRRRDSKQNTEGLVINRVMKWSLAQHQLPFVHYDENESATRTALRSLVQLELDINTIPEYEGELQKSLLFKIFGELVELGKEIATKGDVP